MSEITSEQAISILESCGLAFALVPAGEYTVGYEGEDYFAQPPQYCFVDVTVTPAKKMQVDEFLISKEPLRLSHWTQITARPEFAPLAGLVSPAQLEAVAHRRVIEPEIEVEPSSGDYQRDSDVQPKRIPQQVELDPVLALKPADAARAAEGCGASLPRWYEWEAATRGQQGWLYPWGMEMDLKKLSLEYQDYSVDTESVMGYYGYDEDIVFIHSFGKYVDAASPHGLTGLARAGREWNTRHEGEPAAADDFILRSISDLGGMAYMIPGIRPRPRTWGGGGWYEKRAMAFSGPILACYAPSSLDTGGWVRARDEPLYPEAGFRLVFCSTGSR